MYFQPVVHGTIKGEEDKQIQTIISKKIFLNRKQAVQYVPYFIEWLEDSDVYFVNYSTVIAELELHEEDKITPTDDTTIEDLVNES